MFLKKRVMLPWPAVPLGLYVGYCILVKHNIANVAVPCATGISKAYVAAP